MITALAPYLDSENDPISRELLLRGIELKYGYDFTQYAATTMRRRIDLLIKHFHVKNPIEALNILLQSRSAFDEAVQILTVGTTEMFRDPGFFRSLRETVVPLLRTFPSLKVWCAGCSTGEELFSVAILLKEEGLFEKTTIFATDVNQKALKSARDGIFSTADMKLNIRNYQLSGGTGTFHSYYNADYNLVKMDASLTKNVIFSGHNLATDGVFAEFQLILCRNVLIYFDRELQDRALNLLRGSLTQRGVLGLGARETLHRTGVDEDFEVVDERWRVYQRHSITSRELSRQKRGARG